MKNRTAPLAIAIAFVIAACGGSSPTPATAGGTGKAASMASEVASTVSGPIQIATDATYAPNEFVDPNTGGISGWDIDLGNALCKVMGLVCTFNNVTFDDIIAQLKASTPSEVPGGDKPPYSFSISSWSPTQARHTSATHFLTYYTPHDTRPVK